MLNKSLQAKQIKIKVSWLKRAKLTKTITHGMPGVNIFKLTYAIFEQREKIIF
jgi:hypothetical protein